MEYTKEKVVEVLKDVQDPELQIDVWTLGLIYEIEVKEENKPFIKMTFTSPACPYAPQLVAIIKTKLKDAGFGEPELEFTFDPPWAPSDDVKMILGLS